MTRRSWVQVVNEDGSTQLVEKSRYSPPARRGPMIMPDIAAYQSIVDQTEISSRSKHREHLKRHGMREVGDEKPAWMREKKYTEKHGGKWTTPPRDNGDQTGIRFNWEDFDG